MKKIVLIVFVLTVGVSAAYSQKLESYFQFGIGTGYLMDANIYDTPLLQFEYGKSYKWFDVAAALEYANSATFNNKFLSLILKTKFDFVRMFSENSRHSFKMGAGFGVGTKLYKWYYLPDDNSRYPYPANYTLFSVMASYEYEIANKTHLGVFFNNYTGDTFFGLYCIGLSIRRNF